MKTLSAIFLSTIVLCLCLSSQPAIGIDLTNVLASLTDKIPPRPHGAMTGSEFAQYVSAMNQSQREQAIVDQLTRGNFPDFLRHLKPVHLIQRFKDGKKVTATLFTMPDYLAIGSDHDFLLIPMNLYSALEVAFKLGFILPTRKIVDVIFKQSDVHLRPEPMSPGPQMSSTAYYMKHNQEIMQQRLSLGCSLEALVSGDKKDVVLTNRLAQSPGKIAIYGWHRRSGAPIQPLSTVHEANYADYSHGIRLVSDTVIIDNEPRRIYEVLQDPQLAGLLSDEGTLSVIRQFLPIYTPEAVGLATIFGNSREKASPR